MLRVLSLAGAGLLVWSCSGDGPTHPSDAELTVEDALAQMALSEALSYAGMGALGFRPFDLPAFGTQACPFNVSTQRFDCPAIVSGGLTLNRFYQLLDASGSPQSKWDANVFAVRSVKDMTGTYSAGPITVTVCKHDDATMTGVQEERPTLNDLETSMSPGCSGTLTGLRNAQGLVLPKRLVETYPKSGSIITTTLSNGSPTLTLTLTLTFNGTSVVTMIRGTGANATTCTFDLKTPATPMVCP